MSEEFLHQVIPPNLSDAMARLKSDILKSVNCVKVGRIQSFDGAKKTASVQILFKRVAPGGMAVSYPVLIDCPVFTLQGGGGSIKFPIAQGDHCLVLFADRNIDAWYENGTEEVPFDARLHDLSDGICLVGLNALTSSLSAYPSGEALYELDGAELGLKDGLIKVKSATTDLLTLIEGLIDVLKGISTVPGGGPLNAASIAALEAQKLFFQGLLYS